MMSGYSDCPANLPPEKEPFKSDAHCGTKPTWTFRRRQFFEPTGIQIPDRQAHKLH